ncbi:MAG: 2Fe-2S iron-sulfur cluster-binding protein, partial [Saprospiraceae bacterium]
RLVGAILPTLVPIRSIDHVLICGPQEMPDALVPALGDLGIAADRIQTERFTAAPGAPFARPAPVTEEAPRAIVTAILGGTQMKFPVHGDDALIDAAQRAGLDLPFSCKGGMCCTCRAKILEGTVEMAVNYSLEPWEIAAGFVLTCQSRPTSAHVLVDYDQV